jgi:Aspartyl/Asparaginyl beta-hydroxylase
MRTLSSKARAQLGNGCNSGRTGADRREWRSGEAWFDDTNEHEARNDSDASRAILIFDREPYLTATERDLVRAATVAVEEYHGGQVPWLGRN